MPTMLQRMQSDWDRRAEHDALYWIYTVHGRRYENLEAYYQDGGRHAVEMLSLGLEEWGEEPGGKTILEIGCAIGRLFPGFVELGFSRVIGVDISPEMIRRAKEWCPVTDAQFHLVDGQRLEGVPSDSVDYCFSYNVFQHLPRAGLLWQNLEECSRVLKPGGYLQVHFRGSHSVKQRCLRRLPPFLRQTARYLYHLATLRWLSGKPFPRDADPGHEETWEMGVAVSPKQVVKGLRRIGFQDVKVVPDAGYADGRRFWALARKAPAA